MSESLQSHPVADRLAPLLSSALEESALEALPEIKISAYRSDIRELRPSEKPIGAEYPTVEALALALAAANPLAVETTLRIFAAVELEPTEAVESIAIQALPEDGQNWRQLQHCAASVLGRCSSEQSCRALFERVMAGHNVSVAGPGLAQHCYPGKVAWILEAALTHPAFSPTMAPEGEAYDGSQRMVAQYLLDCLSGIDEPAIAVAGSKGSSGPAAIPANASTSSATTTSGGPMSGSPNATSTPKGWP